MAIKAKVTIFDDETGKIYYENKMVGPTKCRWEDDFVLVDETLKSIKSYEFGFIIKRLEDIENND